MGNFLSYLRFKHLSTNKLVEKYIKDYEAYKKRNPFDKLSTKTFVEDSMELINKLQILETSIEQRGGKAKYGIVTFNNILHKKSLKK